MQPSNIRDGDETVRTETQQMDADGTITLPNVNAASLQSLEAEVSQAVATALGLALHPYQSNNTLRYSPTLLTIGGLEGGTQSLPLSGSNCANSILPLQVGVKENPLIYLFSCYSSCIRQASEIESRIPPVPEVYETRRNRLLCELEGVRNRVIANSAEFLTQTSSMGNLGADALAEALFNGKVPQNFIRDMINFYRGQPAGLPVMIQSVFEYVFLIIRKKMKDTVQSSPVNVLQPLKALRSLLDEDTLCFMLASQTFFMPNVLEHNRENRMTFMEESFMAPFFSFSLIPPVRETVRMRELIENSISMNLAHTPVLNEEVDPKICELTPYLSRVREFLFQICSRLCAAGQFSQNAILSWFRAVLNLNKNRTALRPDRNPLSEDGFILNVMHVLVRISCSVEIKNVEGMEGIDISFPEADGHIDFSNETRLAVDSELLKQLRENDRSNVSEKELNFRTKCFSLAIRSVYLGYGPVLSTLEKINTVVDRLSAIIDRMEKARYEGILRGVGEVRLQELKESRNKILALKRCYYEYIQMDPKTIFMLLQFSEYIARWMVRMLSLPDRDAFLPLPVPVEARFASLPEQFLAVIPMIIVSARKYQPRCMTECIPGMGEIVSLTIAALSSPPHFKNPHLRLRLLELLYCIIVRYRTFPESRNLMTAQDISQQFLGRTLLQFYVQLEEDRFALQDESKYQNRYMIAGIVTTLWDIETYRRSIVNEASHGFLFLKCSNMILNDISEIFNLQIQDLDEIQYFEENIRDKTWNSLSRAEKREMERILAAVSSSFRRSNLLGNSLMDFLCLLTKDDVLNHSFLRPEVVDQLAAVLNYVTHRVIQIQNNEREITDPWKVEWNTARMLTKNLQIYVNFRGNKLFAKAVGLDRRSYNKDLFPNAIEIISRTGHLSDEHTRALMEIAEMAETSLKEETSTTIELGEIPEDYLDPVMGTLMNDPVRLPTSGKVMDRSVIQKILLTDERDPFNRMHLLVEMLTADVDLKKRITQFLSVQRRSS